MTPDLDDRDIAPLLADATPDKVAPLDHRQLQRRGRQQRRTTRFIAASAALGSIAAVLVAGNSLVLSNPAPSVMGTPPVAHADNCPAPIRTTWTCLAPDARPRAPQPDLPRLGVNDGSSDLDALRGSIVVISVWSDWCEPCRDQQADLNRIANTQPDELVVLGISIAPRQDLARAFVEDAGITYPTLLDASGAYPELLHSLLSRTGELPAVVPETFILDRDGRIAAWTSGTTSVAHLREAITFAAGDDGR